MTHRNQEDLAASQFGAVAPAYVTSTTHSQGLDLALLVEAVKRGARGRVLDVGCGGGHAAFALAPHVEQVTACDLSTQMLDAVATEARRRGLSNIATRQAAAERLPFETATFDLVVTRLSAHHWRDLASGLAEARRVITSSGRAFFVDSISPGTAKLDTFLQAFEILRDPSHVRSYSEGEWRSALASAGFEVIAATRGRLRNAFGPWIERMRTPRLQADAILALQARMPDEVRDHFALEPDGTFVLDTCLFEVAPRRAS
jgi:ubiquinone/menaquinone biosynthesis C-methylase UbiE